MRLGNSGFAKIKILHIESVDSDLYVSNSVHAEGTNIVFYNTVKISMMPTVAMSIYIFDAVSFTTERYEGKTEFGTTSEYGGTGERAVMLYQFSNSQGLFPPPFDNHLFFYFDKELLGLQIPAMLPSTVKPLNIENSFFDVGEFKFTIIFDQVIDNRQFEDLLMAKWAKDGVLLDDYDAKINSIDIQGSEVKISLEPYVGVLDGLSLQIWPKKFEGRDYIFTSMSQTGSQTASDSSNY